MVRINLLSQPDKKKRRAAERKPGAPGLSAPRAIPLPLLGGLLVLLMLAGAVYLYFDQNSQVAALEERLDVARQDSTRYSRAIFKLREIEARQSAIAARIQAIQMVDQGRFRWPHILDELSRSLPDNTWLTSVTRSDDLQQADRVEITGVTFSNLTLTQFMTSLESSPYFEQVSLVGSNRSQVDGVDVTSFALVAAYTQPPSS
jgi:type IV pilus assembly protein PilN